jgi:hypothetical protein
MIIYILNHTNLSLKKGVVMLVVLFFTLISVCAEYLFCYKFYTPEDMTPIIIVGASISVIAGFFVATFIGAFLPNKKIIIERIKLVSLKQKNKNGKSVFVYLGCEGSYFRYFYHKKVGKNGYTKQNIPAGKGVEFVEEERKDGELRTYKYRFTKKWHRLVAFNPSSREFAVPIGSLK